MLELINISKRFNTHTALDNINLRLAPGEIHGLLGLNGSGKSTLLNILSGASVIFKTGGFSGQIRLKGETVAFSSPASAMKKGIGMVHQESSLFDEMTIAENIKLGREHVRGVTCFGNGFALPDPAKNLLDTQALLQKMGLTLSPLTQVESLPAARRQFIEFAREMDRPFIDVLLLDEPSASLNKSDTGLLIAQVRKMAKSGTTVLYVSHSLDEVMAVCHKITVLRKSRISAQFTQKDFDRDRISRAVAGRHVKETKQKRTTVFKNPLLCVNGFSAVFKGDLLNRIKLDIFEGEILGLAGLSGHGKSALGPGIMGICPAQGTIYFKKKKLNLSRPDQMVKQGVFLLPDDRRQSVLHDHSILDNLIFSSLQRTRKFHRIGLMGRFGFISSQKAEAYAENCVNQYQIQCRSVFQKAGVLSGGNQQKLSLARSLGGNPVLLFAGEPTRGIDLNAKEVILELLLKANQESGTTIVLSSEEPGELRRTCDRIVVFYQGQVSAILPPDCHDQDLDRAFSGERV